MPKQVEKTHYNLEKYARKDRWVSYFHQISEILKLKPKSVLEIGVGDKVLGSYLKNNTDVVYKSLDIAADLNPDKVGSVTAIPFGDQTFDVVVAFEVLEHLPFEEFNTSLKEICRVSRKGAVISLPHFGPPVQFMAKLPLLPRISLSFKIPYLRKHEFNGEHYWEMGKRGYPASRIRVGIENEFRIVKEFVPFENQYHHFFILEKK